MAGRIQLKPQLTTKELLTRYRSCQTPPAKLRWHALHLISKGLVAAAAARRTGRASAWSTWSTSLARRDNREGAAAVARKQCTRPSPRAKVAHPLGKELAKALRAVAPAGGLWPAPKVAGWSTENSGQEVQPSTAWRAMRRRGVSLQVARPANKRRAAAEAQAAFKKS